MTEILRQRPEAINRPPIVDQIEIIHEERGGNVIEANVPTSLINQEEVPVNEVHAHELAASIEQERTKQRAAGNDSDGQLSAILLGHVPGDDHFRIIDGFHRTSARTQLGDNEMFADIRLDCTEEEIIDLRILTANTHDSIKFSRLVEWVNEAWEKTPWTDSLKITQAFALLGVKTSGKRLGLDPEEAATIKEWVQQKCDQWKIKPMTVYNHLSVASIADPDLVKEARAQKSGHTLDHISTTHLKWIAQSLPNRFEEQRAVAQVAKLQNLSIPETKTLLGRIAGLEDVKDIKKIINSKNWNTRKGEKQKRGTRKSISQSNEEMGQLINELFVNELELAHSALQLAIFRGSYQPSLAAGMDTATRFVVDGTETDETSGLPLAVSEICQQADPDEQIDVFNKVYGASFDRVLSYTTSVQKRAKQEAAHLAELPEASAEDILQAVRNRIAGDVTDGGLHLTETVTPLLAMSIIKSCTDGEVGLMYGFADSLSPQMAPRRRISHDVIRSTLPDLSKPQRKLLLLRTYMGLSPFVANQAVPHGGDGLETKLAKMSSDEEVRVVHAESLAA